MVEECVYWKNIDYCCRNEDKAHVRLFHTPTDMNVFFVMDGYGRACVHGEKCKIVACKYQHLQSYKEYHKPRYYIKAKRIRHCRVRVYYNENDLFYPLFSFN